MTHKRMEKRAAMNGLLELGWSSFFGRDASIAAMDKGVLVLLACTCVPNDRHGRCK